MRWAKRYLAELQAAGMSEPPQCQRPPPVEPQEKSHEGYEPVEFLRVYNYGFTFLGVARIIFAMQTWPFTDYPGITPDRLLTAGALIRDARNEAVDDHRPDKWETNWSLGVRQDE